MTGFPLHSSQLRPGLWSLGGDSWVGVAWVVELSIVVLLVEVSSDGSSNSQEVGHVDGVRDVGVKVVLEVLQHVHVLVHEVVSSDSWEAEGGVVQLPGVHLSDDWLSSLLLGDGVSNVNHVGPVSWVKSSGEHVNLVVQLVLGLVQVLAWSVQLNEGLVIGGRGVR